jgi:dienelactone hydrolase
MAEVILFHHALGVTDGVRAFADQLRNGGQQVTVADLFGGRTFDTIQEGVAYEERLGWDEMIARSEAAIAPLPPQVVIGGFSLGAIYA